MRRYETVIIIDPDLSEEDRLSLFDRLKEIVSHQAGLLVHIDEWGIRKLAYEVKKKPRGYYIRLDYCGRGNLVEELERNLRIDDRAMKYITVFLEDQVDMDQIREEMMQAEAEADAETARVEQETKSELKAVVEPPENLQAEGTDAVEEASEKPETEETPQKKEEE
jgi:small subunit ribosomal protein S6